MADTPHLHETHDIATPHTHDEQPPQPATIPPGYMIRSLSAQLADATFRIAMLEAQIGYMNDMAAGTVEPEVPSAP